VLIVPFSRNDLHASGTGYGTILSAQAIGGIVGALIAKRFPRASARACLVMFLSMLLVAMVVATLALTTTWWAASACLALGGIPTSISGIITITLLQSLPTDSLRGRVFGLYQSASALGLVIGAPVAGFLVSSFGNFASIETAAAIFAVAGVAALVTFPTSISVHFQNRD
jgi:MFS family permease